MSHVEAHRVECFAVDGRPVHPSVRVRALVVADQPRRHVGVAGGDHVRARVSAPEHFCRCDRLGSYRQNISMRCSTGAHPVRVSA